MKWMMGLSAAVLMGSAAHAADDAPARISSDDIGRMVEHPANGTALGMLTLGKHAPQTVVLRRTQTGEPEVHEGQNDLFLVRAGRATVLIGGTIAGHRQTGPGEWRGGTISGAARHEVGPGDVLWIPAGLPHQVTLSDGGDFTYLVVKTSKSK